MYNSQTQLLRQYGHKLCRNLRHKVCECDKTYPWLPCIIHKWIAKLKRKFIKVDVIIETKTDRSLDSLTFEEVFKVNHHKEREHLTIINGFSTRLSLAAVERLMTNASVDKIWLDREIYAVNDLARSTVKVESSWSRKILGKGVGVAVIDTGVHPHVDLVSKRKRIIAFKDLINRKVKPYDDNGHGTHIAGTIAGNGAASAGRYTGIAPEVNIIGVKVLNRAGSGRLSTVISGIQWCIQNMSKYNIKVINLSLGAEAVTGYKKDPVCKAVRKAWDAGICVCVAAGNEGPDSHTISSPGIEPKVITVGASDDNQTTNIADDGIAYFSSRGPTIDNLVKPDLVAPGVDIMSLRSPGSYLDKQLGGSKKKLYMNMSGTSMATPVVAGLAALIACEFPKLTPTQIKEVLIDTAKPLTGDPLEEGKGLVNLKTAIQLLKTDETI